MPQTTSHLDYDDKLEQCCQRLEQLTNKVDRLMSFEQTGLKNFHHSSVFFSFLEFVLLL